MIAQSERSNYEILRECLSSPIIQKSALPERRLRSRRAGKQRGRKRKDDGKSAEDVKAVQEGGPDGDEREMENDLVEFIDVCRIATLPYTLLDCRYTLMTSKYGD